MRLAVGLIGCGPWGRNILRDLITLDAEVFVCDVSAEHRSAALAAGCTAVYENPEDLPEVAGIVVATATSTHAAMLDRIVARGVPAFVEKPMCNDLDAAVGLVAAWGDRLFVMDKWRYHGGITLLGELARSGRLGDIIGLKTTRLGSRNSHPDVDGAWILAPHDLSIAAEILGTVAPLISAVGHVEHGDRVQSAVALMGAIGAPWHVMDVSNNFPGHRREVVVLGSTASATLPGSESDHVEVHDHSGTERIAFTAEQPLLAELRCFLGYLTGGPAPITNAREGAITVRRIAEIRQHILDRQSPASMEQRN